MNMKNREKLHNAIIHGNKNLFRNILEKEFKEDLHLLRFMNANSYEDGKNNYLSTLEKEELWVSSPHTFNDPFDCVLNIDYGRKVNNIAKNIILETFGKDIGEQLIADTKDMQEEEIARLQKNLTESNKEQDNAITNSVYVACFSEGTNINSLLMWGHYAGNQTGICVEYDYREINKFRKNKRRESVLPIKYSDTRIINTPKKKEDIKSCQEFRLNVAFTKSNEWKYEKEWRLIEDNDANSQGLSIPFIKPKSIYLGCKISDELRKDVIDLCKKKNINAYEMFMVPGSFKLDSKPVFSNL